MPDRVKESVFNMLGSRFDAPGALPPILVADVFAGSGSMGLEALSRGAARCAFFERDRLALDSLRKNIDALQAGSLAVVVPGDAWRVSITWPDRPYDAVFLDPPYRDSIDSSPDGPVRSFLRELRARMPSETLVILHHPANIAFDPDDEEGWRVTERRTYGTNGVTMFEP